MIGTIGSLLGALVVGYGLGYVRGIRKDAAQRATLETVNEALEARVQSLSAALAAAKDVPLDHGGSVDLLRELSDSDA